MSISSHMRGIKHAISKLDARPAAATAAFGGLAALAVGGAYMGGVSAQASTVRSQVERISTAVMDGYSPEAMALAAGGLDASALAIANRHDPYATDGAALRDRQAELLTTRLESMESNTGVRPFRIAGARDQSRDLECLTQAVYYEARGEGRDGMKAVAQVVLNRARHSAFPNTVCGVVFQGSNRSTGCQFSFTCNGAMRGAVNRTAWDRARDIASAALSGEVFAPVGSSTHFHTTAVSPKWRHSLVRVNHIGDHIFYRFGGRNGSPEALSSEVRASSSMPRNIHHASTTTTAQPSEPRPYLMAASDTADTAAAAAAGPVATGTSATIAPVSSTSVQSHSVAAEA